MNDDLTIKNKHDTDTVQKIVDLGYAANKKYISDLIFWSCFPNDPVCQVAYPYIASLSDEILATSIIDFLDDNLEQNTQIIDSVFQIIINPRGLDFSRLLRENTENPEILKIIEELGVK